MSILLTFNIKANDPLEQFLFLNLVPGCPVNHWDVLGLAMILGVVSLYIFLELYKNYTLDYKILKAFNVFNYKNFYFYASYLNDYLHFKNTKNNIGLVHILVTKIMSLFMFDARFTHNLITVIVSNIVNFITSIVRENFFLNRHPFFSIYYFSFISILVFNAIGLLPITVTVTSSFVFILNYSFSILVGLNLLGGYIHLTKYFNQFLPEGVPLFIAPVLALIELFSTIIRIFSLTVRLFANMLAGHSLLKIIISVSWVLITFFFFYPPIAFIVWLLLTPIFVLECVIAFLQAYVYVLLLVIYTNDVINIH